MSLLPMSRPLLRMSLLNKKNYPMPLLKQAVGSEKLEMCMRGNKILQPLRRREGGRDRWMEGGREEGGRQRIS